MLFNSYIFILFLLIFFGVYFFLPTKKLRLLSVFLGSYIFYGYRDPRFLILIFFSTVLDFFLGQLVYRSDDSKKKLYMFMSIGVNLIILGFFKYFNFFADSFVHLLDLFGTSVDYTTLNILLPVGISFYTFQTMSYTIDIYRGQLKPTKSFLEFSVFVSFFPQLVAGPIERASHLLPQISKNSLVPSRSQIHDGLLLIIVGLFMKVMIGDSLGKIVDIVFMNMDHYMSAEILISMMLFSIQIYADFAGYSKIARGTAKLFGIELIKNFETPYFSTNITEFWRRWHISLSSWLKDYLYIPLGGNRKGKIRTYINLFITMFLGGLWHGASWGFVIRGTLHGIYLAVHKLILGKNRVGNSRESRTSLPMFFINFLKIVFTYGLVLFAWIFFRLTTKGELDIFFSKMMSRESSTYTGSFVIILISYIVLLLLFDIPQYISGSHTYLNNTKKRFRYPIVLLMLVITLVYMLGLDPAPFMYFQF